MLNEAHPSLNEDAAVPGIASWTMEHPSLLQKIGHQAILPPGAAAPAIRIQAYSDIRLALELVCTSGSRVLETPSELRMASGQEQLAAFETASLADGLYEIRICLHSDEQVPVYDSFAFMVMDQDSLSPEQSRIAFLDADGRMTYVPDYKGNRIADFSNCGYKGGGVPIPDVPVRLIVSPSSDEGDDTARIQQAIDEISRMPIGEDGFRGALLLQRGTYRIAGTLYIRESGVVLRGEGQGEDGTILHGTGAARRDLLQVLGSEPSIVEETGTDITDLYVPSGSRTFHVANASGYSIGDTVAVIRYGNADWISAIDMDTITPRPNAGGTKQWAPFELLFDRVITDIEGNRITLDAPVTNAIEARWGGGRLFMYDDKGRIEHVGLEQLRIDSDFNPDITDTQVDGKPGSTTYCADESHTVNFVRLNYVKNAWVRDVTGYHLEHSLVTIDRYAKWVTVQDCTVRDMVSIITGGRRYCFHVTGQLALVQRCDTETARHAFVFDAKVSGPNVFLDSESRIDYNASEPHHRWSVGGLFDNVRSPIYIRDRGWMGSGHGWAGANYVAWNTEGKLTVQQPPTAQNYAIGHAGTKERPFLPNQHDLRPREDGFWDQYGQHVEPRSLYLQQLKERLGDQAVQNISKATV
ncbi:hypothetical protein GCM10023310_51260 [Paenibacillus vulneris]|uniref:Pectate lyase n=1 Tax=Paenibacillus vulneris TaxID=1133364 RepID=A0ABW3UJP8_9BACL